MAIHRPQGSPQPGLNWGPFTLRIPFVHTHFALSEFLQGLSVAAATGLALVPLLTGAFGLSFEEAVTMSMLHSLLISSSWMIFGEPYCPGWVTPALPFALIFVLSEDFVTESQRFQAMTALSLDLALILVILGVSGIGKRLIIALPEVLKGGIILGAALAAFIKVFDVGDSQNVLATLPYTAFTALALCLILAFSVPLQKLQNRHTLLALIASYGLLPAFIIAGVIGHFTGEIDFKIEWGVLTPPLSSLWEKASPFSIGWPSLELYLKCLPLAFITYIILFGDLITGEELLQDAKSSRPDEVIVTNMTRSHLALGIRNAVMAVVAPFFPTQGALWTGVHVVVLQRWRLGRKTMDSLFDGIAAYYLFGFPIIFLFLPLLTTLKPLMGIALAMTLILTGFACANIALPKAKSPAERGSLLLTAVALCMFEPWQGLLIGLISTFLLAGQRNSETQI